MVDNLIVATFGDSRKTRTIPVFQWDYGMLLAFADIELPETYEVHFCNEGDSETLTVIGDASGVAVPDELLQKTKPVLAYIYLHTDEDDGETVYAVTIPVINRAQPTDVQPLPPVKNALEEAIEALNRAIATLEGLSVSATTLDPGAEATVTKVIDETTGAISFAFGIPKGDAPVRGVDYWTAEDKEEIVNEVFSQITSAQGKLFIVDDETQGG